MDRYSTGIKIQLALKRILDIMLTISGLILLLPVIGLIALAIKLDSEGPVFYRHRRIGKGGVSFDLLKFRSMSYNSDDSEYLNYLTQLIESDRDNHGRGLPYRKMLNDSRVTRVGRLLRRYYLDELPQVWNILVGDMSLVGPRPHVQLEVDHYLPCQRRRLAARPGATGLWQVAGKADCTFNELIALDLDYIDHWNLWLDLKIVFRTISLMLHGGEPSWNGKAKLASVIPALDQNSQRDESELVTARLE